MNFHSKRTEAKQVSLQALETVKTVSEVEILSRRYNGTNLCFLGIKMPERVLKKENKHFNMRV